MEKTGKREKKRLLLIGATSNPIHIHNYYNLIRDYFDEILIVGTEKVSFCESYTIDFRIKNPFSILKNIRKLRKKMNEFQPDIVHVHQANSVGFITALANKKRFPMVLTTWGDDVLILPKKNFIFKKLATTSLKYADAVTADAAIMRTAIHSFYGEIPVTIANFGIEIQTVDQLKKEKIIYSNRLHEDLYNIDKIIDGAIRFLKEHPDWKLIIAGAGKNTALLKDQVISAQLENQVEFTGFLKPEENRANYLKATLFVSIPNTDGTSISLLEAMAYGCIPVVSDLPANKEWIKNGENGIIASDFNVDQAISNALLLDKEHVIAVNQKIINERATKEANRIKFTAIYDQLLNR